MSDHEHPTSVGDAVSAFLTNAVSLGLILRGRCPCPICFLEEMNVMAGRVRGNRPMSAAQQASASDFLLLIEAAAEYVKNGCDDSRENNRLIVEIKNDTTPEDKDS